MHSPPLCPQSYVRSLNWHLVIKPLRTPDLNGWSERHNFQSPPPHKKRMYRIIKSDNNTKNNPKYPPLHPKHPPPPQGFFVLMHNVLQHPHTCTSTKHDWPGIQQLSCYKTDDCLFGGSGGYVSGDCLLWRYTIFP